MNKYTIRLGVVDENNELVNKLFVIYAYTMDRAVEKARKYAQQSGWEFNNIHQCKEEVL